MRVDVSQPEDDSQLTAPSTRLGTDARRFSGAAAATVTAMSVPYLWVLSDLWTTSPSLLRTASQNGYASNFYDLQARAMLAGRLSLPDRSLGIEAYFHGGRTYTYFGLFPSLLRIPVLLVTHNLDGRLTAVSMLIAWLFTALFTSLLIWRLRVMARGTVRLGSAETVALSALVATVTGGSVLVFLAANPFVFSEDLAWSVTVTLGSLFALLGVLERPSTGRVVVSGVLILAATLTRAPSGYACVIGAVLTSIWLAAGHSGAENRRWWAPVVAAGFVPLVVGCVVNIAKFGVPFGLPISSGLVYKYLGGPNGGHEFSLRFLPSTLDAYLSPSGIRLTRVFPFITLPGQVAEGVGGVSVYGNRTASLTATMPLLFLLAVWGSVSVFRPRALGKLRAVRVLLIAAVAATGVTLIFGWIYNRYLADFLPLLVLASSAGAIDIWARLQVRRRLARVVVACLFVGVALLEVAVNTAVAITPSDTWTPTQTAHYVEAQQWVGHLTGNSPAENVEVGYALPNWAPADRLFVQGYCDSVYISDGEAQHGLGWLLVERGHDRSLCFSLVNEKGQPPVLRSSLIGADAAFARADSAYTSWILLIVLAEKGWSISASQASYPLMGAVKEFNASLRHVMNEGLPNGPTRGLTSALLADSGSLQDALSNAAHQTHETLGNWFSHVGSQWRQLVSGYSLLLEELLAPAMVETGRG